MILAKPFEIDDYYKTWSYSLVTGFQDRYGDFYGFFSKQQECKRQTLELEKRVIRYREKQSKTYVYGSNSRYDEVELGFIFQSEVLKMTHSVVYNCYYSWKFDVYRDNLSVLA